MGFSYDPEALTKVATTTRSAASSVDAGLAKQIPAVDAGVSSEIVGLAVTNLVAIGLTLAHTLDKIAEGVDATHGSYAEVENNNEGAMRYNTYYQWLPGDREPGGPLKDGPLRSTVAQP
jgi:hypothetical protein